jgi:hypothetical protein
MVVRGEVINSDLVEVEGRGGDLTFRTPDAERHLGVLVLSDPGRMLELYGLKFDEILDYLEGLGERLRVTTNPHLRRARELSYLTTPLTPPIVDAAYDGLSRMFERETVREMAQLGVGIDYLEGWVETRQISGVRLAVRCFGARTVHVVAGNSPMVSALTIIRNAILRSDAIIKAPSNDPFTASAIAQTMIDFAPAHPITRHLSVVYWRGGDAAVESNLYQPSNIDKIVAWGGFAALKHITQYIQPGLELISLDPKRSASIVGAEALQADIAMAEAAQRLASDIGAMNQVGCVNARVVYVLCGTGAASLDKLNQLGQMTYDAMLRMPPRSSTTPKRYDPELRRQVDALRMSDDWYRVIGGDRGEGAIIVSQIPEPVDFSAQLGDRTGNLVPVDSLEEIIRGVDAYTQTVGVYPESLKSQLIDVLPLYGAQRFVSLGFAVQSSLAKPQDGIEPLRRMGKWIVNEIRTPEESYPPWAD